MDDQSLALTVELLRQDVTEIFGNRKGKQVEGTVNDAEFALQIYQEELAGCLVFLQDRQVAQSMGRAVHEDGHTIAVIKQEEDTAINDRRMALNLAGGRGGGGGGGGEGSQHVPRPELDEKTLHRLSKLNIDGSGGSSQTEPKSNGKYITAVAEPLSQADNSKRMAIANGAIAQFDCTACMESKVFFDIIETSCSHHYCRDCIRELFEQSFSDESLFPPRCCRQPITLSQAGGFLGGELVKRFQDKSMEYNDPSRTYCSNPVCSIYLPAETFELNNAVKCSACQHSTCVLCKKPAHSKNCVEEKLDQAFLELVRTEEWQKCFKCHSFVELRTGCYHITCRCGAQFCYLCGEQWKNCRCEKWDDNRLLERGQEVAAREQRPGDGPLRRVDVDRMVMQIRERHECNHSGRWERINGRHQCEEYSTGYEGGTSKQNPSSKFEVIRYPRFGPFQDSWLREDLQPERENDQDWKGIKEMATKQDGPWPARPVFSHGDLNPFNILVCGDEVVGLVDWECAGWYPYY
ncbi:hypothetical protein EMCG_05056 [[Emmonsia] crescens]|uniref:RBR-type E3 ubiquitin transferase n=1 Tax=[Emmonsia] crescens TaxID=73230 RepID=A0A0G2J6R0_9EURO|nr:hypothetical protein EMCG_05056 [Emmonsia crescens UAMH 3008]